MTRTLKNLQQRIAALAEPQNLFQGVSLPENFALPDNILLFYHDYCAQAPNAHNRCTLVFPLDEMRYYVDQQEFNLKPGDILFIRPYSLRFLAPESASYKRFFITFQLPCEQTYLPGNTLLQMAENSEALLEKMLELFPDGDPAELAVTLCKLLATLEANRTPVPKISMSSEIARALAFINENLHNQLSNRIIAEKVNMSLSNLARRFKREVGTALHDYIEQQRLEFARYYLQKTSMQIDEIAERCGFLSTSSFSHFFKQKTAFSPLAYRKKAPEQPEKLI